MSATPRRSSGITTAALDASHRSRNRELSDIPARARKLAAEAIGIDSHIDTVQRVLVMGEDLAKRWNVGHVDIPRLHEGAHTRRSLRCGCPCIFQVRRPYAGPWICAMPCNRCSTRIKI